MDWSCQVHRDGPSVTYHLSMYLLAGRLIDVLTVHETRIKHPDTL